MIVVISAIVCWTNSQARADFSVLTDDDMRP
jgi:hypothetical protein